MILCHATLATSFQRNNIISSLNCPPSSYIHYNYVKFETVKLEPT